MTVKIQNYGICFVFLMIRGVPSRSKPDPSAVWHKTMTIKTQKLLNLLSVFDDLGGVPSRPKPDLSAVWHKKVTIKLQ